MKMILLCWLLFACIVFRETVSWLHQESKGNLLNRKIFPQPTWRVKNRTKDVRLLDVISVLSRFDKREDFYEGKGYSRAKGLLDSDKFYQKIQSLPYKRWPLDTDGNPFGSAYFANKMEFENLVKEIKTNPPSKVLLKYLD